MPRSILEDLASIKPSQGRLHRTCIGIQNWAMHTTHDRRQGILEGLVDCHTDWPWRAYGAYLGYPGLKSMQEPKKKEVGPISMQISEHRP